MSIPSLNFPAVDYSLTVVSTTPPRKPRSKSVEYQWNINCKYDTKIDVSPEIRQNSGKSNIGPTIPLLRSFALGSETSNGCFESRTGVSYLFSKYSLNVTSVPFLLKVLDGFLFQSISSILYVLLLYLEKKESEVIK